MNLFGFLICLKLSAGQTQITTASVLVESVQTDRQQLSCSEPNSEASTANVTVNLVLESKTFADRHLQIWLTGYKLEPSTNRIIVKDEMKELTTKSKHTSVTYRVTCGPESINGAVTLFASVVPVSQGIRIPQEQGNPKTLITLQVRK